MSNNQPPNDSSVSIDSLTTKPKLRVQSGSPKKATVRRSVISNSDMAQTVKSWEATKTLSEDGKMFSLSFRGFSLRSDLWVILIITEAIYAINDYILNNSVEAVAKFNKALDNWVEAEESIGNVSVAVGEVALYMLPAHIIVLAIVLPVMVRRSRQLCGTGYYAWWVCLLLVLQIAWQFYVGNISVESAIFVGVLCNILTIFFKIPLLFFKGRYGGRKNELMRAAICGDLETVKKLAPTSLLGLRSEYGYTARQYAKKMGHKKIAAYLKEMEEQQQA